MSKRSSQGREKKTSLEQADPIKLEPDSQPVVLPVVREELKVGKREIETGKVTVQIVPHTERKLIEQPLEAETVDVERVPVNRIVERAEPPREEGDVTVVPVYQEVLVIEKKLMLKEEVRIARRKRTLQGRHEAELRCEEVHITRTPQDKRDNG